MKLLNPKRVGMWMVTVGGLWQPGGFLGGAQPQQSLKAVGVRAGNVRDSGCTSTDRLVNKFFSPAHANELVEANELAFAPFSAPTWSFAEAPTSYMRGPSAVIFPPSPPTAPPCSLAATVGSISSGGCTIFAFSTIVWSMGASPPASTFTL